MGKASRWFRSLLGLKNSDPSRGQPNKPSSVKRWSFAKSDREMDRHRSRPGDGDDDSKHAIAVAAATAAVAEAAVAAAQAAAAVVQLTSSGRNISKAAGSGACGQAQVTRLGARYRSREDWAAVIVQSHFRAYLSRRALRALKALVKLQALVRGHLVRKQTADALRRLQALVRAQARARAGRALNNESPQSSMKPPQFNYRGPSTPERSEQVVIQARSMKPEQHPTMLKRNSSKSSSSSTHFDCRTSEKSNLQTDEKNDKILEVDSWNPLATFRKQALSHSSHPMLPENSTAHCQSGPTRSPCEARSPSPLRPGHQNPDEVAFCKSNQSPTFYSATSSRSCFSNYSDFPSYMACTESSRAKTRSASAPKQRPQYERSSSAKRCSIHGFGDLRSSQRVSGLHADFRSKAYPGSGRLDRLGMPVGWDMS